MVGGAKRVAASSVKWCAVSLDEVVSRGKRLEASVFDIEALNARAVVCSSPYGYVPLMGTLQSPVARAYYGGRGKRNYVPSTRQGAIGFIGSSEMLDCCPYPVKFMADTPQVDDLRVKHGDILMSRSGTIGNLSFVNDTLSKLLVSEHAIRIECRSNPGYVYAFLKSQVGQLLVKSGIYGAVILEVEPDHLESIPIPDTPDDLKQQINDLVVKSYELRDESNAIINKATTLLVDELQLPSIDKFKVKLLKKGADIDTFSVKLDDLAGRLDCSYHVPLVGEIVEHLKKHAAEVTTVADPRISKNVILPPRFARVYVEEGHGIPLVGGKQIHELDPSNKKHLSRSKHIAILSQLEVRPNYTLITRSGTIGKVGMVPRHWDKWVPSDHIIRVVPASDGIAGFLNIWLSSEYAHPLVVRHTYGSVIDEIDAVQVRSIPVPLLKDAMIQDKINALALRANEKRYEAYTLEQQALSIMDREVLIASED